MAKVNSYWSNMSWLSQAATVPPVPTMTLRVVGFDRPIIAHSREFLAGVLTIGDVLEAVKVSMKDALHPNAARRMRWAGLYESSEEAEVWFVEYQEYNTAHMFT